MTGSAGHGSSNLEPGCGIREAPGQAKVAGEHPRNPVSAPLMPLPNVVQEGGGKQIRGSVVANHEPARGVRAVQDVACMLRREKLEQGIREALASEPIVRVGGKAGGMTELAQPLADHSTRSKTSSCTARMIQVMGLRPTKLRRKRTMSGANPTRASISRSWVEIGSGASPQTIL